MIKLKTQTNNFIKNIAEKGFFHLLSANFLIQILAFGSQLFVAGILSPDDIGRIKIIQTFISIFSIISGLGLSASTLKLCSENRSKDEQLKLFGTAILATFISATSIYAIIIIINIFGIFSTDKTIQYLIPLGLLPIIFNSIFLVFVNYFQAIRRIKFFSKLAMTNKLMSIIAIIFFAYLFGINGYFIAYNLSLIIMVYITYQATKKENDNKPLEFRSLKLFPTHWKYARSSMFANIFAEFSAYIDIILISLFIYDMKEVGYYSFALTLTVALRIFPSSVQQIASPYFSSFAFQRDEIHKIFKRYNKILIIVIIITLLGSLLIVPIFINFIFQGKYDHAMHYFLFLAIGWSIRQLTQLQSGAIFGMGKIHYNALTSLISLIINIILYSAFMYHFGLIGAAYASIPAGIIIYLTSYLFFKKALNELA